MVFSQTSLKAHSVLKVVNLDHSKTEKNYQLNGTAEVASSIDGYYTAPSSPAPTTSFTEVSNVPATEPLKLEPLLDDTMLYDLDSEFFQELEPYYVPEKEEVVQTIDSFKKTEEKALDIDQPLTPQYAWGHLDVNSPQPQAGYYNALSPNEFGQNNNLFTYAEADKMNHEKSFDINSLPMVLGGPPDQAVSWPAEQVGLTYPADTAFNIIYDHNATFINTEDSVDLKIGTIIPTEVNFTFLNNAECNTNTEQNLETLQPSPLPKRKENLSLDVTLRAPAWSGVSTPALLNDIISLEENSTETLDRSKLWPLQSTSTETYTEFKTSPKVDYEPITPKSESLCESDNDDSKSYIKKRRRHDSEDSDETYTPHSEPPPKKYKKRKNVPVKDLLAALENQPKVRRGRPPKRRESTVSSVYSVDENSSSLSTHENKYRELRDKNNEASKRSRMNRKVKEQQMEDLAEQLEEENKQLKVQVDILEQMTKKMKNELMAAMLNQ